MHVIILTQVHFYLFRKRDNRQYQLLCLVIPPLLVHLRKKHNYHGKNNKCVHSLHLIMHKYCLTPSSFSSTSFIHVHVSFSFSFNTQFILYFSPYLSLLSPLSLQYYINLVSDRERERTKTRKECLLLMEKHINNQLVMLQQKGDRLARKLQLRIARDKVLMCI